MIVDHTSIKNGAAFSCSFFISKIGTSLIPREIKEGSADIKDIVNLATYAEVETILFF